MMKKAGPSKSHSLNAGSGEKAPTEFLLYQTEDGQTRIEVRMLGETVWLSLKQLSELFDRDKSVISRHINNLFEEGELQPDSVVANFATTAAEIIDQRADSTQAHMGMTAWQGSRPHKADTAVRSARAQFTAM